MGLKAVLEFMEYIKTFPPAGNRITMPGHPACSIVTIPITQFDYRYSLRNLKKNIIAV